MHKLFHDYINGYGLINYNPPPNGAVDNGNSILEFAFALLSSNYENYSAVQFRSAILPHIKNDILHRAGKPNDLVSYDEYIGAISASLFYAPEIAVRLSEKLIKNGFIVGENEIRNNFSRFLGFPALIYLAAGIKPTLLEQLSFFTRTIIHSIKVLKKSNTDWSGVRMTHMICRALESIKEVPMIMKLGASIFKACVLLGPQKAICNVYYNYYSPDHSIRNVHLALGLKW
jgi:hypothetical protein